MNQGSRIGGAEGGWNVALPGRDGAVAQDASGVTAAMFGTGVRPFSGVGFGPVSQVVVHAIVSLAG